MKTCGEALVEMLEAYGIDTVFGIPGVHTVELYRGLPNTRIRHITPRHEQGAGFMADGYARASGKPAACFIITGPGMTNITTAMGQALADSVPMLVISSVNNTHELGLGEGRLHELPDQRGVIAGVSIFSQTVIHPKELPKILARAFSVFDSARPGPVHIELPLDIIVSAGKDLDTTPHVETPLPVPNHKHIERAASLLKSAKQPFIVLGGGTADAAQPARELVELINAPTALTINAKGVLPPNHPLSLSGFLPSKHVLDRLQKADIVLAIGTELGETDTHLFDRKLSLQGQLIRIDIDPEQLSRNATAEIAIVSDAGIAIKKLITALGEYQCDPQSAQLEVSKLRIKCNKNLPTEYFTHGQFLNCIATTLPDVIMVGDSTQPIYGGNFLFEPSSPRSYFNSSTGYGTLGYGLPAALGAKLSMPHRHVVSIIGDGGLQFTIAELATAVELGLSIPIIIWNNYGYGEIKQYMIDRNIPQIGVDIYTPDFIKIAIGFGCHAYRVNSIDDLVQRLETAANAKGPTIIEIDDASIHKWAFPADAC